MKFTNQKIAVLGLGIEGVDICKFLIKHGAKNITLFDQKTPRELGDAYKRLKFLISNFKLGSDYLKEGLTDFDIIFRSPAFKLSLPEIAKAKKADSIITSATKLFFDLCPARIIGVTGTKGKGTTATLIYKILKKAGKKVFLAGNIGEPMLALLPRLNKESWVVLELSSFQLQDLTKSPYLAVVLFITSEHLDYHRDTQEYAQAKSNIVRYQKKGDLAVLNFDNPTAAAFASLTPAKVYFFSRYQKVNGSYISGGQILMAGKPVVKTDELQVIGEHNWDNVGAAVEASFLAGADLASIRKVVSSFKGLEHRLEFVRKFQGVSFYNDSFSTTPETTIAAIKAFNQPLILIAGGSEKGSDFTQLGQVIAGSQVETLILIGQMADRIRISVQAANFKGEIISQSGKMKTIVKTAFENASVGDIVLLSPGCASFDMFADYKDRGNQFKNNVQTLKANT